jgi:hypothetical protein
MIVLDVNIYWHRLRQALAAERLACNNPELGMRDWLWENYDCQLDLGRETSQTLQFNDDAAATRFVLEFA